MLSIGIMQGRLSPPTDGKFQSFPKYTWEEEFYIAQKVGLNSIEWIFEADEWEDNPISSDNGIKEILEVIEESGTKIESVCADYFMDVPYLTANDEVKKGLIEKLKWLISQSAKIGIKYIDIPFVDSSQIHEKSQFLLVKEFILQSAPLAEKLNIILALETSLGPEDFKQLLTVINHPFVMVNYDTGNSSGIGYNCVEELTYYGKYIRTIHIKDREINNGTKPLGNGSADFDSFFRELFKLKYNGPIVLQAAREDDGKELETAEKNRKIVEYHLNKYQIK